MIRIANSEDYRQVGISGNEPTLSKAYLLRVIEMVDDEGFLSILETNGFLIDEDFARKLSEFENLHVRVSLKGCDEEQFSKIAGARPEFFDYQLRTLHLLFNYGISSHPAILRELVQRSSLKSLRDRLKGHARKLEFESLKLYPHIRERLEKAGIEIVDGGIPEA